MFTTKLGTGRLWCIPSCHKVDSVIVESQTAYKLQSHFILLHSIRKNWKTVL